MVQAVSRESVPRGSSGSRSSQSMCNLWRTKWHWDRFYSELFGLPLSVPFRHNSPYSYITWGMKSRPVGGRSSET
jgi:hypothetical protein